MEKTIKTLAELAMEAEQCLATLTKPKEGATLVTLSGDLGAGKTAFTKELAHMLGVDGVVTSPTFVLEKIYQLPADSVFMRLVHIDAYRLEGGSDLVPLGFDEIMRDSNSLVLLEWPEKVSDALPIPALQISIEVLSDGSRKIIYG